MKKHRRRHERMHSTKSKVHAISQDNPQAYTKWCISGNHRFYGTKLQMKFHCSFIGREIKYASITGAKFVLYQKHMPLRRKCNLRRQAKWWTELYQSQWLSKMLLQEAIESSLPTMIISSTISRTMVPHDDGHVKRKKGRQPVEANIKEVIYKISSSRERFNQMSDRLFVFLSSITIPVSAFLFLLLEVRFPLWYITYNFWLKDIKRKFATISPNGGIIWIKN